MKVSIITVAHDKDLEYLKLNLQSINKFCKSYHENIVVIDDHKNDCDQTRQYLDSINQKYIVDTTAKNIKIGYIRQQYMKLFSEQHVCSDTDFICHVDCDNLFFSVHEPSVYFEGPLPVLGIQSWSTMNKIFKPVTDQTLEYESDFNFMRRMPLVYPAQLFHELRSYITELKGDLIEYLNTLPTISEYNLLGAYAYKFKRDSFHWVDVKKNAKAWAYYKSLVPCEQYSSKIDCARYMDLSKPNHVVKKITD